jgi:sporulation protein YlmC with PRC-barrel domain
VVDRNGQDLGEVDDLILDWVETQVRFLDVPSRELFGFWPAKALIPVDAIIHISDQVVFIDQTHMHVAAASRYDPDLIVRDVGGQGYVGDMPLRVSAILATGRCVLCTPRAARILVGRVDRRTRHGQHVVEDLVCQCAGAYNHDVVTC